MCDSTALQKRISRVLEIGAENPAMLESLAVVSSFLGKMDNCNRASSDHHNNQKTPLRDGEDTGVRLSQAARKGLGDNLEKENRYLAENFVGCFGKVMQRLNNMEEGLEGMERGAESIIERLEEADESVKSFSQRTKALRRQRSELETRAEEVESLLNKFQLSSEENDILNKGPEESSDNFFVVLARLKVARDECHKLVGSLHQSAGFELLDALSHQQEIAYERLYHWVLENCDAIEDSAGSSTTLSQATFNPALHRALNALSDRPAFFRHCQERIVGVRRVVVRKSFFAEFSQGFYSGDVVQYLGDVLAWVHQTSAAQHEFVVGLVGEQASKQLVLHIMAGIAKPLLTRLEPLLVGQKKTIVLARAPDLLGFYNAKLLQFTGSSTEENDSCDDINEEKSLSDVLSSLRATARSEFLTILRTVASQIESSYPTYFVDHSPLQITTTSLRLLVEVLDARDSSLFQEDQAGDKDGPDSTANVIGFFVDPLLSVCRKSGQGLASGDTSVFMLNNIHVMQSALAEKAGASSWVEELTRQAEGYLDEIVTYESKRFLVACGMGLMLEAFHTAANSSDDVTSVCGHLGASQAEVENVMGRFYSALFSMALPDFERIQEPWAREQAKKRTAELIANAHRDAYTYISDPSSGYVEVSRFLVHTPDQCVANGELDADRVMEKLTKPQNTSGPKPSSHTSNVIRTKPHDAATELRPNYEMPGQTLLGGDCWHGTHMTQKPRSANAYAHNQNERFMYDGKNYCGLAGTAAEQSKGPLSVEHHLYKALLKRRIVPNQDAAALSRCGRTDRGVHALGQVVAFRACRAKEGQEELDYCSIINSALPQDIRCLSWSPAPDEFSARFCSSGRTYRYYFVLGGMDLTAMQEAAKLFVGTHDFRNLCKLNPQFVSNHIRDILHAEVRPLNVQEPGCCTDVAWRQQVCIFEITGKAFLWHMIRCMMSVLFMIGEGKEGLSTIKHLLDIDACPGKPSYQMADENGLVLHDCLFHGIQFKHTPSSLFRLQADLEKQWQEAAIQAARGQEALSHLSSQMISRKEVKEFARRSLGGKMGKGGVRRHTKAWKELWRKKECYVEALSEEGLMTWGETLKLFHEMGLDPVVYLRKQTPVFHVPLKDRALEPTYDERLDTMGEKGRERYERHMSLKGTEPEGFHRDMQSMLLRYQHH